MPRQLSPEREVEFAELSRYIEFISTHVLAIDPADPDHTSRAIQGIVEQYGKSRALEGLRQAANDTVEQLSGKPLSYIQLLDSKLREAGVLTISEVRRRHSSSYKRIVKRGRIKGQTEFYLVAGVLSDSSAALPSSERELLEKALAEYESEV